MFDEIIVVKLGKIHSNLKELSPRVKNIQFQSLIGNFWACKWVNFRNYSATMT
jgi:hypothetical protein